MIEDFIDPNIFGGYEYALIETKALWAAHEKSAITWGGHLASFHSHSETLFVAQWSLELNMKYTWLGRQRISYNTPDGSNKSWKWSDETNWDYSTWSVNQPNSEKAHFNQLFADNDMKSNVVWNKIFHTQLDAGVYKRITWKTIEIHIFNST